MKILMVLTFQDQRGDTSRSTGLRLEEFAAPYYVFADAGAVISLATPEGGQPPLVPGNEELAAQIDATRRFATDPAARAALANTAKLTDLHAGNYDALFYPGVQGHLRDLATDPASLDFIEATHAAGRTAAEACHAPAVFSHARAQDGTPLVSRRRMPGSGGSEEAAAAHLVGVVPFVAANVLRSGAVFQTGPDWQPFVLVDGTPVTGQYPASSEATARVLLRVLAAAGDARQGHAA